MAKTSADKKFYAKKVEEANALIKANEEKVIPYIKYVVANL
jgi:hypothetical protein